MAPLQVIGAGFARTGTHSLCMALDKLGYHTCHMKEFVVNPELDPLAFKHNYLHPDDPIDWDEIYKDYDASVDLPTFHLVEPLMKKYPDAKVILTIRSPESWYKSASNTIFKMWPVLKERAEQGDERFRQILDMASTIAISSQYPDRLDDEEFMKSVFTKHNERIKALVPPEHLLIMELGDGWEKLCPFLGKDIPDEPYPRGNSTEEYLVMKEGFKNGVDAKEAYELAVGKA